MTENKKCIAGLPERPAQVLPHTYRLHSSDGRTRLPSKIHFVIARGL